MMKQITKDWVEISGLVRRINYLTMSPKIKEKKGLIRDLDNKLFSYFSIHNKPYNPAIPE